MEEKILLDFIILENIQDIEEKFERIGTLL